MSATWIVLDLGSGRSVPIERFPFLIGGGMSADLRLNEVGLPEVALELQSNGSGLLVSPRSSTTTQPNGSPVVGAQKISPGKEHGFLVGGAPILVVSIRDASWTESVLPIAWLEEGLADGAAVGRSSEELRTYLAQPSSRGQVHRYRAVGTTPVFSLASWVPEKVETEAYPLSLDPPISLTSLKGRCPQCWMVFRPGEVLAISCHEDLRGDPILGSAAMRRFLPRNFDEDGFPLDEMGYACRDLACPHCRHKLPLDLFRLPFHIISLVGIQRAGKSYLLAILAKIMSQILARDFATRWEDLDPTGNIPLNELRNRLFAAPDAESAALEKTSLGGVMYTEVHRAGRVVSMPRPFIYRVTNPQGQQAAFIFYDNAGEHFMPGIAVEESPGAMHVTEASSILFLFDPLVSTEFRQRLGPSADPQMQLHDVPDIQDVVLDEMRVRFARARGHAAKDDLNIPFGVLVGKCDAWIHLAGGVESLQPVVQEGCLDRQALAHNSECTRKVLKELCPEIVARLDALSSRTMYFPVSAFGHTPLQTSRGVAPDPKRLFPILAEAPILWALDILSPDLLATR